MNEFVKQNWFKLFLAINILLITGFFILDPKSNDSNSSQTGVKRAFVENNLSSSPQITCTYPQTLIASYEDNIISHVLPRPETNPLIFTFSELDDPKGSQLSFIDSTQSINTVSITKLSEDEEKIIYVEGDGKAYLTIHTLYKRLGLSTYVKNANLLGIIPVITSAMGSCVGY